MTVPCLSPRNHFPRSPSFGPKRGPSPNSTLPSHLQHPSTTARTHHFTLPVGPIPSSCHVGAAIRQQLVSRHPIRLDAHAESGIKKDATKQWETRASRLCPRSPAVHEPVSTVPLFPLPQTSPQLAASTRSNPPIHSSCIPLQPGCCTFRPPRPTSLRHFLPNFLRNTRLVDSA